MELTREEFAMDARYRPFMDALAKQGLALGPDAERFEVLGSAVTVCDACRYRIFEFDVDYARSELRTAAFEQKGWEEYIDHDGSLCRRPLGTDLRVFVNAPARENWAPKREEKMGKESAGLRYKRTDEMLAYCRGALEELQKAARDDALAILRVAQDVGDAQAACEKAQCVMSAAKDARETLERCRKTADHLSVAATQARVAAMAPEA